MIMIDYGWRNKPDSNLFGILDQELCFWVYVSQEKRQNNVDGKKCVNYAVCDVEKSLWRRIHERNLEGIDPCRVSDKDHHEGFPAPERTKYCKE